MNFVPGRRVKRLAIATGALGLLVTGAGVDASVRRAHFDEGRSTASAVVAQLGFPDLALSSSARWLRTPTQSERTAPLADAPIAFDTDPAGAVLGPTDDGDAE